MIPARSGSKGVPNKNIKKLGGYSLLEWSIAACKKCKFIDDIYVSTDSEMYRQLAISKGAKAPFLRPKEISSDFSTDYEFITHSLDWLKNNKDEPEIIVHIRPTTPLRSVSLMNQAIQFFLSNKKATALRSVHEMSESAYKTFEISKDGKLNCICSNNFNLDFSNNARQNFPKTYAANGYIDLLSTKFIRDNGLLHGDNVIPFITPFTIEVDNAEDFEYLEYIVKSRKNFSEELFL